jgi:hypothetical protein
MNEEMGVGISKEEIKEVLNSFYKEKSLGINGWKIELFL